jgi:GNAT superfamily N-acetyltransferase
VGTLTPTPSAQAPLSGPAPINEKHDVSRFDCGKVALNDWLRSRALKNEGKASRCFVVCDGQSVVGFYALAAGAVRHDQAPRSPTAALKRNMPTQIPVLVLGRMAVDGTQQGKGLGGWLLKDALQRALSVASDIGARAVLVHAIDQEVVPFYTQYGFRPFPGGELTLFLSISDIAAAIRG